MQLASPQGLLQPDAASRMTLQQLREELSAAFPGVAAPADVAAQIDTSNIAPPSDARGEPTFAPATYRLNYEE